MEAPNDEVSFINDADDQDQDQEKLGGTFATNGKQKNNYKGKNYNKSKVTCHRCGKNGHYAPEWDKEQQNQERQTGKQMLMARVENGDFDDANNIAWHFHQHNAYAIPHANVTLKTSKNGRVPKAWMLLNNQLTVDVFCNDGLLQNIRCGDGFMDIHCNAGVTSTDLIGNLPGYGEVWYNPPNGIALQISCHSQGSRNADSESLLTAQMETSFTCTNLTALDKYFENLAVVSTTWTRRLQESPWSIL
jgi:hypothetical protein